MTVSRKLVLKRARLCPPKRPGNPEKFARSRYRSSQATHVASAARGVAKTSSSRIKPACIPPEGSFEPPARAARRFKLARDLPPEVRMMSRMLSRSLRLFLPAFTFTALFAVDARAFVGLSLTDGDGTPSSAVVLPGSTLTVTASLLSTTEKITGVDYYLQITNNGAGKFRLLDRNIGASQFSDLTKSDTGDNGANPGVEDATVSLLNPRNGLDLGAGSAN